MKKLLLALMFVCLCVTPAFAQTWYTANQVTVGWDAVAPIVSTDTVKYQVYTKVGATGTPSKVGGEITATQLTISFSIEGRYFIGVETVRYPQGETVGVPSATVAWSNNAADCAAAGPFGITFYVAPGSVKGLRTVP